MNEERRKVLDMLGQGKINADEADRLLEAIGKQPAESKQQPAGAKGERPRWLHIDVNDNCGDKNIRVKVPLMLLRTGLKLGSLIPGSVQARVHTALGKEGIDIDLSELTAETADELIDSLSEMKIDVDAEDENVRIYCA